MKEDLPSRVPGPLDDPRRRRGRAALVLRSHSNPTRAWGGNLTQRVRVTRQLPQAVLKITSHSQGLGSVRARLHYISRKGALSVETDEGVFLEGTEELDAFAEDWSVDFSGRRGSQRKARDTMNLFVSLPSGADRDRALEAARDFFKATFSENHEYVFAAHDDSDHFHVHLIVKLRGRDGKVLRASRKDPELWRQGFAEKARSYGIELDASPRYARGQGTRSGAVTPVYEIRQRGGVPDRDTQMLRDVVKRIRSREGNAETEHEEAIRAIHGYERLEYAKQARGVMAQIGRLTSDRERLEALKMASDLAVYAERMPEAKSKAELLKQAMTKGSAKPLSDTPQVRRLTKETERAIRNQVKTFSEPGMQKEAISARVRLSRALGSSARSSDSERDRDFER